MAKTPEEREAAMETDSANPAVRCWINQPSTHQPYHNFHGMHGIWTAGYFYFLEGEYVSVPMEKFYLSAGWPDHPRLKKEAING